MERIVVKTFTYVATIYASEGPELTRIASDDRRQLLDHVTRHWLGDVAVDDKSQVSEWLEFVDPQRYRLRFQNAAGTQTCVIVGAVKMRPRGVR